MSLAPPSLGLRIDALARTMRASGGAPPGLPHFWLEHPSGTSAQLLERLSTHGIFRKYEHVLDLGGGLGGVGRWLALRLGCTAVTTTPATGDAIDGALLTRRAGLAGSVHHLATASETLPMASERFTHVWVVESLAATPRPDAALAEAFRVLRPGGHFVVQELVGPGVDIAGWRFTDAATRARQLAAVGLVEVTVRDVTREAPERVARVTAGRARLEAGLDGEAVAARQALAEALHTGALGVVQLSARRP